MFGPLPPLTHGVEDVERDEGDGLEDMLEELLDMGLPDDEDGQDLLDLATVAEIVDADIAFDTTLLEKALRNERRTSADVEREAAAAETCELPRNELRDDVEAWCPALGLRRLSSATVWKFSDAENPDKVIGLIHHMAKKHGAFSLKATCKRQHSKCEC